MNIYELRFRDGRGASLYTTEDVTEDLGTAGAKRVFLAASSVSAESPVRDATKCFASGAVVEVTADMGAVAYVVRHQDR